MPFNHNGFNERNRDDIHQHLDFVHMGSCDHYLFGDHVKIFCFCFFQLGYPCHKHWWHQSREVGIFFFFLISFFKLEYTGGESKKKNEK